MVKVGKEKVVSVLRHLCRIWQTTK